MQKKNLFSFHFQVHVSSPSLMAKLLKSRAQNKRFQSFLCRDGVSSPSLMAKLLKSRAQNKETRFFFYAIRKISILGRMLFCTKIIIKDDKVTKK